MRNGLDQILNVQVRCSAQFLAALAAFFAAMSALFACPAACHSAVTSYDGGIVIDNGHPEYSEGGTWEDGKNQGDYYRYGMDAGGARKTTSAGSWAEWTPNLPAPGKYRVYLWHIVWGARGQVTIEIKHDGKTETLKRNTGDGHSGWNNLGDYDFAAGTSGSVKVTLEEKGALYADAVKFLPIDKVDKTTFPPYPKPDGSTPRVDKGNIVVCGEPRLILYGETLEEVMTHPADVPYYGDQFDKWRRQGLNTVAAILQWNAFEPRKDEYEYAMIDGLIEAAKERNMHLIIVWFGTWRNLQSNYVPRYIWDEKIAFPALKQDGKPENGGVSPFATKCAERDGLALKALLARAAQKDPGHQVLIAVQVENEMPCYADFSPAASEHIGQQVPKALLDYLKANDTPKHDPTRLGWFTWSRYHGNGSKTSGTWEEVFGKQPWPTDARKAMGAYYTGKYIEIVVQKAKEALNIPMYANAWCGESPCDCEYMDIFHVGCASLDGVGPDNPGDVLHKYIRPWNKALVQPEFSPAEHYFRALSMGAMLVGQYWQAEVELMRTKATFDLVRTMEPLLVEKRNPGDLLGFTAVLDKKLHKAGSTWEQDYQDLKVTFTATMDHIPGETEWRDSRLHTAGPLLNGNGLIIRMGPDDYIITSTRIDVELRRADGSDIGVASAEQGHFEQGQWVKEKDARIPGDGKSLQIHFPAENGSYGQIRLKLAGSRATSQRPQWNSETRQVKVATPTGEQVKEITFLKNSLGMEFVRLEPGEFLMGQPGREKDNGPSHRVRLTRPFLMGAREVTQAQWIEVMGTTIEQLRKANDGVGPDLPMYNVSWHDATEFCQRLSALEDMQYRLPTEAEWEYGCRAGTTTPFYTGETIRKDQANYDHNWIYDAGKGKDVFVGGGRDWGQMKVVAAGSFPANPWGLYDMLGNVYEWCADFYDADYYSRSPVEDPKGPDDASMPGQAEKDRVTRGFCFCNVPNNLRSWNRCHRGLNTRDSAHGAGFRMVVEIQ